LGGVSDELPFIIPVVKLDLSPIFKFGEPSFGEMVAGSASKSIGDIGIIGVVVEGIERFCNARGKKSFYLFVVVIGYL
jgi:hypothetical protein